MRDGRDVEAQRNARMIARRQAGAAARRRAALARWQEGYDRIAAIRPRCEGERQAQVQALELMEQARPG